MESATNMQLEDNSEEISSTPPTGQNPPPMMPTEDDEREENSSHDGTNLTLDAPPPILKLRPERMNFKCKLSTKCRLKEFVEVFEEVFEKDSNGRAWFKESQFGHLLEVPKYLEMNLTSMWMMLCREVQTKKNNEIWFVVNGTPIRFSLMEYALISGLRCSPYPEGWKTLGGNSFRERHFKDMKKVSIKDIKDKLLKMQDPPEERQNTKKRQNVDERERANLMRLDKLKMTVLFFISSVLMHPDKDKGHIGDQLLSIVDDLDACCDFPWGRSSYVYLMRHLERIDIRSKSSIVYDNNAEHATLTFPGFIIPLTLLPFECIPVLSPEFAKHREDVIGHVPRICRWMTSFKKKQSPPLEQVLQALGDTKDIKSILIPTTEEEQADYMHDFTRFFDESDATIDQWMEIIESGDEIFWEDVWHADIGGRCSFLRNESNNERDNRDEQQGDQQEKQDVTHDDLSTSPRNRSQTQEPTRRSEAYQTNNSSIVRELKIHLDQAVGVLQSQVISRVNEIEIKIEEKMDQAIEVLKSEFNSRFDQLEKKMDEKMEELMTVVKSTFSSHMEVGGVHDSHQYHTSPSANNEFLQEDDGYYNTPICSMDEDMGVANENIVDIEVEQLPHVAQPERPKRQVKRSKYRKEPYTDPHKKKVQFEKGTIKCYDPMRLPDEMRSSFNEYYNSPSRTLHACGLQTRPWIFFHKIFTQREWLDSEYLEEAMYGVRKRQQKYSDIIKQDSVVLDEIFGQLLLMNFNEDKHMVDEAFMKYVNGKSHKFGRSWRGANALYFPLNVNNSHWLAIKIDCINTEVVVFDCSLGCLSENAMDEVMLPIQTMIPLVLCKSKVFEHIKESLNATWQYRRRRDLPQNSTGDCAIYAIKFIEFDMQGYGFQALDDSVITFYREKMAVEIFHDHWLP